MLVVDQFEEVFTACRGEQERAAFLEGIADLVGRGGTTVVVVALRADFYGRCAAYPRFAALLSANHILVGPMERDELASAIEMPAAQAGLGVERELVGALVGDTAGEPGALPLLQARRSSSGACGTTAPFASARIERPEDCVARSRAWPRAPTGSWASRSAVWREGSCSALPPMTAAPSSVAVCHSTTSTWIATRRLGGWSRPH